MTYFFGCNGPLKPKASAEFLERDCAMIEEHNKLIKEHGPFEEDSSFNFIWFQVQVFSSMFFNVGSIRIMNCKVLCQFD